ncbi:MAG: hypothetical protein NHB36_11960 [Nitrospira sp.]|nr:hypothetical protein [Nitrospira sp.]
MSVPVEITLFYSSARETRGVREMPEMAETVSERKHAAGRRLIFSRIVLLLVMVTDRRGVSAVRM